MQDDFDSGMGMPDDELAGGSAMSDIGEAGLGGAEGEGEAGGEPARAAVWRRACAQVLRLQKVQQRPKGA